jgi:hypothetical protein
MGLLYGRAGRLNIKNAGFRPGQMGRRASSSSQPPYGQKPQHRLGTPSAAADALGAATIGAAPELGAGGPAAGGRRPSAASVITS